MTLCIGTLINLVLNIAFFNLKICLFQPGHFDGPAPTIAPTLYDEDLPWLGFHFDTKQVMFKKIDDDDKMPIRMAPSKC